VLASHLLVADLCYTFFAAASESFVASVAGGEKNLPELEFDIVMMEPKKVMRLGPPPMFSLAKRWLMWY
jgi:hypothetical protein